MTADSGRDVMGVGGSSGEDDDGVVVVVVVVVVLVDVVCVRLP